MSGPAGSRDHQPRGTSAQANDPIRRNARSPKRAQDSRAFLLTKTFMEAGQPNFESFTRKELLHCKRNRTGFRNGTRGARDCNGIGSRRGSWIPFRPTTTAISAASAYAACDNEKQRE
jgi:hypothetical protein